MKMLAPQPSQILTVFTKSGQPLDITLDGGATGSFIKYSCAIAHKFRIWPNNQSAGLADSKTSVKSIGYIEETFFRDNWSVKFRGLVVENLKADVYGGQPFMIDNDIIQRPAKNIITVQGKYTVMQTNSVLPSRNPNSAALVTLAKLNLQQSMLFPGQCMTVPVKTNLPDGPVLIEPKMNNRNQIKPFLLNDQENIVIKNDTTNPVMIPQDLNVLEITACATESLCNVQTKPHIPEQKISHNEEYCKINDNINHAVIDDNLLHKLHQIHKNFSDVFDGKLTGYNGNCGKHAVSIQWADETRPKSTRVHVPTWSANKDVALQRKIDQLTEMGVLADPYEHNVQVKCVHPCFLQKKARAAKKNFEDCSLDELRFLTAPNAVNEKCRQIQTKIPDQNEVFKFLSNNKYVIFADLYESFFQNHLDKKDWGYMAISSPFKGLRVYTRSSQGLLNQDEELSQLLFKVLGDNLMQGHCMKIADDLLIGGNTTEEAINNWEKVLSKLSAANLKLSPSKVRIFPNETSIYGWSVKDGTITPDPHRKLALSKAKYSDLKTISDVRSWTGIYKTFLIAMPGLAQTMDPFDRLTAGVKDGKIEVVWTPELIQHFQEATKKINDSVQFLALPQKHEQLIIMPDATVKNPAIGFTLNVIRDGKLLPVIFYSFKLQESQKNWWPCEQEALAVATSLKKSSHYVLNSSKPTLILTDSKPVVEAFNLLKIGKFSTSSRMSAFLHTANQFKIDIQHISGKFKQNLAPDYLSRNPADCPSSDCQVCRFIQETAQCTVSAIESQVTVTGNHVEVREFRHVGEAKPVQFNGHIISAIDPTEILPIGTRKSWADLQQQDHACSEALKRLKTGQQPYKKGPFSNEIRRYYNACQAKDLLVVVDKIPNSTQTIQRIVVPKSFVPAVITQLHHREQNHPSAHQLEKLFNRYFFGINVKQTIDETVKDCVLCKSNKFMLPNRQEFEVKSRPQHPGSIFNIDVMRRQNQKVMVCRDLFSSFTTAVLLKTEQADCLLKGIISCISAIRSHGQVLVRTDSATGFQALCNNPSLMKLNIKLETTDPANKNSVASVDNAIKELEQELCKLSPHDPTCNETVLSLALESMNSKIRNRGLSAKEIIFSRDNYTNKNIALNDRKLAQQQLQNKTVDNRHSEKVKFAKSNNHQESVKKGDTVAFVLKPDKTKSRDIFLVTDVFKDKLQVNKIMRFHSSQPKIQTKSRIVPTPAVYQITDAKQPRCSDIQTKIAPQISTNTTSNTAIPWRPYRDCASTDDEDEEILKTPPRSNKSAPDPYSSLRTWEKEQRTYARRSLSTPDRMSSTKQLVESLDSSFEASAIRYTPDDNEGDLTWDNFTTPTAQSSPEGLSRVHYVDDLYDEVRKNLEQIQTDQVQNLDHVLPIPECMLKPSKKKRVSPPRPDLPLEREERLKSLRPRSKSKSGK